ncbi:MAG: hypothetical protein ABII64_01065 [Elusimicrobiota bacterium]
MRLSPAAAYKILYKTFGPQGWWPVTKRGKLSPEYAPGDYSAGSNRERFEICAGAILTQNTAWKNVEKAIYNLNEAGILTPGGIRSAGQKRLAALIRPSGYFNQKAERLRNFAAYIRARRGGDLKIFFSRPAGIVREELLLLNGIGPETADSMLLYAGGKPVFVVDAYTCRLVLRMGWLRDAGYDKAQKFFKDNLPASPKVYNEFHALIVALGKDYCRKKPLCGSCPLREKCGKKGVRP